MDLQIPEDEFAFTFSRAGGPGGQNVNKVSSRVTLRFNVMESPSLTDLQKARLLSQLPTRISKDGVLWIVCQETRSQLENRVLAMARFHDLISKALAEAVPRRLTKATKASRERRLAEKNRHSALKKARRSKPHED